MERPRTHVNIIWLTIRSGIPRNGGMGRQKRRRGRFARGLHTIMANSVAAHLRLDKQIQRGGLELCVPRLYLRGLPGYNMPEAEP